MWPLNVSSLVKVANKPVLTKKTKKPSVFRNQLSNTQEWKECTPSILLENINAETILIILKITSFTLLQPEWPQTSLKLETQMSSNHSAFITGDLGFWWQPAPLAGVFGGQYGPHSRVWDDGLDFWGHDPCERLFRAEVKWSDLDWSYVKHSCSGRVNLSIPLVSRPICRAKVATFLRFCCTHLVCKG